MEQIKKYLRFFFQTKRLHPMHIFALICVLITIITLPFEIVSSIVQKDLFQLIAQSLLAVSFIVMFFGLRQAFRKNQLSDSQDFRNE